MPGYNITISKNTTNPITQTFQLHRQKWISKRIENSFSAVFHFTQPTCQEREVLTVALPPATARVDTIKIYRLVFMHKIANQYALIPDPIKMEK